MALRRIHVCGIARIALPFVDLRDGGRVQVDPADARAAGLARLLEQLDRQGRLVYLEVDATTATVLRLLIPQVVRVIELRAIGAGGFDVRLEPSAARHQLRPLLPDFAAVEAELRRAMNAAAPAVVTEDDAHDILHARLFVPALDGVLPPLGGR
jgi:hypothetical protein